jgi:OOP family OmpA-OmpF porin
MIAVVSCQQRTARPGCGTLLAAWGKGRIHSVVLGYAMIRRTGFAVALTAVLAAAAQGAWAEEADSLWNFYLGAGLGVSKLDNTACDSLESVDLGTQQNCDDQDTGWKVYAGWKPLKNIAFEAGFVDLGSTTAKGGATNLKAEADGGTIAALAFVPGLEKVGLFIKGGYFFYEAKLSGRLAGIPIQDLIGNDTEESDQAPFYGMGLRLPLNDSLRMNVEFERYLDIGDDSLFSGGKSDVNFYSVGAVWMF